MYLLCIVLLASFAVSVSSAAKGPFTYDVYPERGFFNNSNLQISCMYRVTHQVSDSFLLTWLYEVAQMVGVDENHVYKRESVI